MTKIEISPEPVIPKKIELDGEVWVFKHQKTTIYVIRVAPEKAMFSPKNSPFNGECVEYERV
jgi:hypothetical protein